MPHFKPIMKKKNDLTAPLTLVLSRKGREEMKEKFI
jgi:hypothetical protein